MFATLAVLALAAIGASATPLKRGALSLPTVPGDNNSCAIIGTLCEKQLGGGANSWQLVQSGKEFSISKECILSAICYQSYNPGVWNLDNWIQTYFTVEQTDITGLSKVAQRLPVNLYDTLVTGGSGVATQQSFIDAYYSLLATTNGPYPTDPQYVIDMWARIAAWTGFCGTKDIPYSNLADWFQYSSTSGYNPTC